MRNLIVSTCILMVLFIPVNVTAYVHDSIKYWQNQYHEVTTIEDQAAVLHRIAVWYWNWNPDSSLYYSNIGLRLPADQVKPFDRGWLLFARAKAFENGGQTDSTLYYLQEAAQCFSENDLPFMYNRVLEQQGGLYRQMGQYDTAMKYLEKAEGYFKKADNAYQINSVLINIGNVWLDKSELVKALDYYLQAIAYDSILNDPTSAGLKQLGIGMVYTNLGNLFLAVKSEKYHNFFKLSASHLRKAFDIFNEIGHQTGICYTRMNMIDLYISQMDFKKADSLYHSSGVCLTSQDTRLQMSFAYSHGILFYENGQYDSAMIKIEAVDTLKNNLNIPQVYYRSKLLKAKIMRRNGQVDSAYKTADAALIWFKKNEMFQDYYQGLTLVENWYREDGELAQAQQMIDTSRAYFNKLICDATNEIFDEVALRYENETLQQKLLLEKSAVQIEKSKTQNTRFLGGIMLLILILSIGFLLWKRKKTMLLHELAQQKAKSLQAENRLKEDELEKIRLEKKLNEELAQRYQLDAELREQELIFQTLKQTQINQLNNSIREKLGPFKYRLARKKDQELFETKIDEIAREAGRDPLSEFEVIFTQMHNGYYEKLLCMHPDLTRSELQLCALLRLNLPTKEIANLLYISMASVDQKRHQIRKKFNMEPNQNLNSFFINI